MIRHLWAGIALTSCMLVASSVPAHAQEYSTKLSGFQEVGALNEETGAILSEGTASLKLTLDKAAQTLTYTLTYSFPSTTTVTQSHIHFGKEHVPGNIMVYFCVETGVTAPPPTPAAIPPGCPTNAGTVTGTITAQDVTAKAASQNITAGDFANLVSALESDTAYANIHTTAFPAGEIRGQIHRDRPRRPPFPQFHPDGQGQGQGR
jgi:CHRD domain